MYDLVLFHAPSIYDFRERRLDLGPISDVIPSTPIFEMYPIGFLSILNTLISQGYSVKIINLAVKMLDSRDLDIEKIIKKTEAYLYGLDLHWLPHVQGVLEISKIIKKQHPNRKIVVGGLSATYYATEILKEYQFIDFVLKGDTTEPFLPTLIDAVEKDKDYEFVLNLVWRKDSKIIENPCENSEKYIDYVSLNYRLLVKNAIMTKSVSDYVPYGDWLNNPSAMTFIQKGCQHNCTICGGSNFAYRNFYCRDKVSIRDPEKIVEELKSIQEYLGIPAFVVGDIHEAGKSYEEKLLSLIKKEGVDIPIMFELFSPAPEEYYKNVEKTVPDYVVEISPESSVEVVRNESGKFYDNISLEKNIEFAMAHNAKKIDVFFSIGIPSQTLNNINQDVEYIESLYSKFDRRLHAFTSPISPFIDPGSLAFERSEKYGYKIYARTLKDHYQLLNSSSSWIDFLNYDTNFLSKEDIARSTLESGLQILQIKYDKGILDDDSLKENIKTEMKGLRNRNISNSISPVIYNKEELIWSKKMFTKSIYPLMLQLYRKLKI